MTCFYVFVFKGESIATPIPEKAQRCKKDATSGVSVCCPELCCLPGSSSSPEIADSREALGRDARAGDPSLPPGVMCLFFWKVGSDVNAALRPSASDCLVSLGKVWSHTTAQALELTVWPRLVSDPQQPPCLNFPRVGITGTTVPGSFLSSIE